MDDNTVLVLADPAEPQLAMLADLPTFFVTFALNLCDPRRNLALHPSNNV